MLSAVFPISILVVEGAATSGGWEGGAGVGGWGQTISDHLNIPASTIPLNTHAPLSLTFNEEKGDNTLT